MKVRASKQKPRSKQTLSVSRVRKQLHLSQSDFAAMISVPVGTVRNWEQGLRSPRGPALALLKIAAARPDAVVEALNTKRTANGRVIREAWEVAKKDCPYPPESDL